MGKRKYDNIYEEIINWLKTHNGNFPRGNIIRKGRRLKIEELTDDETKEVHLAERWRRTPEHCAYVEYKNSELSKIPEEYQGVISRIKIYAKKTTYEKMKEWLTTHEGKTPRKNIRKNGKTLTVYEMTEEEKEEVNLNQRWKASKEYQIFKKYINEADENIPKEYIRIIREYKELMKQDNRIRKIMRKAVGKRVGDNEETRKEIEQEMKQEIEYQR